MAVLSLQQQSPRFPNPMDEAEWKAQQQGQGQQ